MARLCGLILAAGASSRMGTEKALLTWPPSSPGAVAAGATTLLSSAILALQPFTQAVVVVTGKNAGNLAPVIAACSARMVLNPDPERGQFSSLQTGLREVLACGCDAAMITPVDCPPLSAATLHLLRDRFEDSLARGQWAVAPESNGRHGHPLLAGRSLIDAFLAAPPTSNAREIRRAHARFFEYVAVPDLFLSADMNTPEEYAAASSKKHQQTS
jgi:CTP:molybdopterin cytidylyltransferase MocA